MAEYHLFTTWDLEAPIKTVWEVISEPLQYPNWWKYVDRVSEVEPRQPDGSGGTVQVLWKTALPYSLAIEMRGSRYDPPHVWEGSARGELEGVGRWELKEMEGFTRVTYDWRISTTQAWMNLLAPLARPVFVWNHDTIMKEGGRAIAAHLGVRLLAYKTETLN
jgi:uncharacterized protein YndB with AHSA1/START domain